MAYWDENALSDFTAAELLAVAERVRDTTHRVIADTHRTIAEAKGDRAYRAARLSRAGRSLDTALAIRLARRTRAEITPRH